MSIRADGNLNFDTAVDATGFKRGVDSLETRTKGFFKNMASVVKIGALTAGAAVAGFFASSVKVGTEYEAQMSRVKAISGATTKEIKALDDQAIKLGADTSFSASEAAAGMENLASAGFTAKETMAAMPGLLDLAAVSGGDVAASSEVAASTLRAFGMEASKAGHVADVFAQAASSTNAETADMGEAMKYVAPVSHAMGISLEETAAAIGVMSNAGIKGSEAGTSLRGALSRLAKPSKFATEVMKKLNLEFYDSNGKMKPLKDQVEMLKTSFKGLTDKQKQNALVTLYGQESLSGMLALIDAGPDKLQSLTTSLTASDGAAKDMAKTMRDNLKGNLDNLSGSIESLQIKLFKSIKGGLNKIVSAAGGAVQGIINHFDDIEEKIKAIIKAIKVLLPLFASLYIGTKIVKAVALLKKTWQEAQIAIMAYNIAQEATLLKAGKLTLLQWAIGLITGQIKIATAAQKLWNLAMDTNPIMLAVTAIGLLITAVVAYDAIIGKSKTAEETERLNKMTEAAQEAAQSIDDAKKAGQEMAQEGQAELNYTAQLKDELDGLVDANGKVKKGYENRAKFITTELADATGIEVSLQNGVIEGYKKLSKKIDQYIEKKRAQIWLEANEDAYKAAIKNQNKLVDGVTAALKKQEDAQAEYAQSVGSRHEATAKHNLDLAKKATKEAEGSLTGSIETIKGYESDYEAFETGNWKKLIEAHEVGNVTVDKYTSKNRKTLQATISNMKTDLATLEQLYADTGNKTYLTMIKDKKKAIKTKQDEMDGMKSTVKAKTPEVTSATKNMLKLAKEAAAGVDFTDTGKNIVEGLKKGADDPKAKKGLLSKMISVLSSVRTASNRFLGIHSPSTVFAYMGKMLIEGLSNGIGSGKKRVVNAIDLINKAIVTAQKGAYKAALTDIKKSKNQIGAAIDQVKDKIKDLREERANLAESVSGSLSGELDLGNIAPAGNSLTFSDVSSTVSSLATRVKKFAKLLAKLAKIGIPSGLIQEVAALGTTKGIPVATALASGTKSQIKDLASTYKGLGTWSDKAGKSVANSMYNVGINAQKGLLKGLLANKKDLQDAIKKLSARIVKYTKSELGIKSPSTVFRNLAKFIPAGMSLGLLDGAQSLYNTMDRISTNLTSSAPVIGLSYSTPMLPAISTGTIIPAMATIKAKLTTETNVVMQKMIDKLNDLEMKDVSQVINFNEKIYTPGDAKRELAALAKIGLAVDK